MNTTAVFDANAIFLGISAEVIRLGNCLGHRWMTPEILTRAHASIAALRVKLDRLEAELATAMEGND